MINTDVIIHSSNINSSPSDQRGKDFQARRRPWCYSYASKGRCSTDGCHCHSGRGQRKDMVKNGKLNGDNQDEFILKNKNIDLSWLPRSTQTAEELARKSSTPRKCELNHELTRQNGETAYEQNQTISRRQANLSSREAAPDITGNDSTYQQAKGCSNVTGHRVHPSRHHFSSDNHNTLVENSDRSEIAYDVTIGSANTSQPTQRYVENGRHAICDIGTSEKGNNSRDAKVENHVKLKTLSKVSSFSDLLNDASYKTLRRVKWTLDGRRILYDNNSISSFSQHSLDARSSNTVRDKKKVDCISRHDCCNNHFSDVSKKINRHDSDNTCEHSMISYDSLQTTDFMTNYNNSSNLNIPCGNHDNSHSQILTPKGQCSSVIKLTEYNSNSVPHDGNISVSSIHSKSTDGKFKCDLVTKYLSLDTKLRPTTDSYLNSGNNTIRSEETSIFDSISSVSNMISVPDSFEPNQVTKTNFSNRNNDSSVSGLSLIKTDSEMRPNNLSSHHDDYRDNIVFSKAYPLSSSYSLTSGNNNLLSKLSDVSRNKLTSLMNALKARQRATIVTHDTTHPPDRSDAVPRCDNVVFQNASESRPIVEKLKEGQLRVDIDRNEDQNMKHLTEIPDVCITDQFNDQTVYDEHLPTEISNNRPSEKLDTIVINGDVTSSSQEVNSSRNSSHAAKNDLLSELQKLSARLNNLQYSSTADVSIPSKTSNNSLTETRSNIKSENIVQDLRPFVQFHSYVSNVMVNEYMTDSILPAASKFPYSENICDSTKHTKCLSPKEMVSRILDKEAQIESSHEFEKNSLPNYSPVVTDRFINSNDFIFQLKSTDDIVTDCQSNLRRDTHNAQKNISTSRDMAEIHPITQYFPTILDTRQFEYDDSVKSELLSANDQNVANDCEKVIQQSSTIYTPYSSPSSYFPIAQAVKRKQLLQIDIEQKYDDHKPLRSSTEIISVSKEDEVSDSSIAEHFVRTTLKVIRDGVDYNNRILQPVAKKRFKTKKIRNKLLHNHCHSPMSDASDDVMTVNRKFTNCSLTSKKRRKRSSPIGQLLKSYLHQVSSSDVEIDGLPPFLKVF